MPSMDMVRMCNPGTEATMSAIRLARGFTGRDDIVKFEECYHGHSDSLIRRLNPAFTSRLPPLKRTLPVPPTVVRIFLPP